jgi:hypothetical protein
MLTIEEQANELTNGTLEEASLRAQRSNPSPSLRAQRSNPEFLRMDCFGSTLAMTRHLTVSL